MKFRLSLFYRFWPAGLAALQVSVSPHVLDLGSALDYLDVPCSLSGEAVTTESSGDLFFKVLSILYRSIGPDPNIYHSLS